MKSECEHDVNYPPFLDVQNPNVLKRVYLHCEEVVDVLGIVQPYEHDCGRD